MILDRPIKLGWHMIMSGDGGGYGYIGSQNHDSLRWAGADIIPQDSFDWDLCVCVSPPRAALIGPNKHRPDLVFHTMFEAEPLPERWPDVLNRAGLIWSPSQYCIDLFQNAGVTTPMFKVGYAVDTDVYTPRIREDHDGPFKVLVWADSLITRKNPLVAIKAFVSANLPDAELEVKVSDGIAPTGNWMIDGKVIDNITVHTDYWRRQEIVRWLQSGDVGIYLSGGEGYGLMPKEAMATGLPMIMTANTGMLEYVKPEYALVVESPELEKSNSFSVHFGYDMYTYKPNFNQVVEHLRWAYYNRPTLYAMGAKAIPEVTRQTWKDVGTEALWHLTEYFESL